MKTGWVLAALVMAPCAMAQEVVKEIVVKGNKRISREAILAALQLALGKPFLESLVEADEQTLYERGFFRAVDIRALPVEGGWQLVVEVSEFPEVKEIRVAGNTLFTDEEILAAITLKPGAVFDLRSQQESVKAIRDLYTKKGAFVLVEKMSPLEGSPETLNVELVETRVGSVTIEGNNRTSDEVMRRVLRTRRGDVYTVHDWAADLRRIAATEWFKDLDHEEVEGDLGEVNLRAIVQEDDSAIFNFRMQMDPRSRFAGGIELGDKNFRGTGQRVGLSWLQGSKGGSSFGLDYGHPFFDDHRTSVSGAL